MTVLRINNLSFTYPEMNKPALKNMNLAIEEGDFVVLCGKSGCGKSTLLRHFKSVLTPYGTRTGEILYREKPLEEADLRTQSQEIGYVLQSPENQIVTDKVWHELAFGLESLGYDTPTIRLRVAEMASYFGIQGWFKRNVVELSGGQKQLLNLASIMAMHPAVLILDEPTSQLDPIAASDFLETVKKINRELGTTIIMTEHRLEDVLPVADQVVVMDEGEIIATGTPRQIGKKLRTLGHDMFLSMPAPMQIFAEVESDLECPITVREGRKWMSELFCNNPGLKTVMPLETPEPALSDPVVELKEVWFRYDKNLPDVVKDLSLRVRKGEFYCLVGGNGTGKTTSLSLISGINKPYRGKVLLNGRDVRKLTDKELFHGMLGVLPQSPQSLFVKKTVERDLYEMIGGTRAIKGSTSDCDQNQKTMVDKFVKLMHLEHLLDQHPYDLSGGEQQRLALAKIMLLEPQILLLDEPTKGLDNHFKRELGEILRALQKQGVTIIMVSHDIEFCALFGDVCGLFFDGSIVTSNSPRAFFSGNSFYTTSANRMSRHIFENAITVKDVITCCQMNF
ncbi:MULTISPECIES: ABC transporter ATP-binding protein [unclassified Acetobacterium]|jgi:energy-coupling factor transport system ATP-binding protein|uniref:ABC transporter ATP-binding protein n=1 Tax=unclassified Acetobacterium TaxID=2638182 RepID=UPI000DBEC9E0|nr:MULTISPECIES: ABC transporter ATP-binding protein [unclassified Acetobacterium]AWW26874.1 ABC transporter ATP-binding protein [Acetobacterium sp. KB-1]MDZ5725118.1 energy-coupling factor transporter ATPase [Acetobacterium sp. K1/6]